MTQNPVNFRALRPLACAAAIAAALLTLPGTAAAQISAIGATAEIAAFFVRGVDVAADPSTGGYLVVGAQNTVVGICVNGQGQTIGSVFTIKPHSEGNVFFGAYPRARYSPHANGGKGAFLVVWPQEEFGTARLHTRMVSCTDGLLGTEQVISEGTSSWLESGAAVAYSATSQRFFVAWKNYAPNIVVQGRLVDLTGAGVGSVVPLSSGFARDPGVAWNSATNDFGVSFSGETATTAYSAFVKVPADNPGTFARTSFNVMGGAMTTITDIDYNPNTNRYVMTWFELISSGVFTRTAEFDAAGNLIAQRLASASIGSYDALGMAYNNVSKTFLIGSVDRVNDDVFGLELDGSGVPIGGETKVSTSTRPARYPRVASSATHSSWNLAFNTRNFSAIANQVVQTGTVGSPGTPSPTPTPTPTPTPPPATPQPFMAIDTPRNGGTVPGNGFSIGGWALDAASTTDTGVSTVHIWAYPTNGAAATFLGVATYGISRGDVGAAFGSARFTPSGFGRTAELAPGTYDIAVFPYSKIAKAFTAASVVRVQVVAPVSVPRMWVDTPAQNDNLSQNVTVAGWALDLGSGTGTGVSTVHVWAYPGNDGAAMLVGVASYGSSRPDVGAAFGSSQFNNSGFRVQGTLPPGGYTIVAFAYSSVVKAFNNVFVIPVRVY
ncbi:MAG: hypothetical protein WEB50_11450 [Vicinamibacterales bacterium]